MEVEPTCSTTKVAVSNVGLKSCSKFKPNLNCLSESDTIMKIYENLYHRSCFRKLIFDILPGSRTDWDQQAGPLLVKALSCEDHFCGSKMVWVSNPGLSLVQKVIKTSSWKDRAEGIVKEKTYRKVNIQWKYWSPDLSLVIIIIWGQRCNHRPAPLLIGQKINVEAKTNGKAGV